MGIAGAGNSSTLMATLFAPRLAQALGWRSVFGIAIVPVLLVWIAFFLLAKDAPLQRKVKTWGDYAAVFKVADTGWFCWIYSLTFGGFVGLASYLSVFFHDQYQLTKVQSSDVTTAVVLCGSFLRPVGEILADKLGGYLAGLCLAGLGTLPSAAVALALLAVAMRLLGMGNGSLFQVVPQRFASSVGIMTGVIGAAAGFCGFLLPSLLGILKDKAGSFSFGVYLLALMFARSLARLSLRSYWTRTWSAEAALRAGLTKQPPVPQGAYLSSSIN